MKIPAMDDHTTLMQLEELADKLGVPIRGPASRKSCIFVNV